MRKGHIIVYGGILLLLLGSLSYGLYLRDSNLVLSDPASKIDTQSTELSSYKEQVDESGAVNVTIKPTEISEEGWSFEVTLQTHSVELDMDILASVVLIDADGAQVRATKWDGDPPGGHHRMGTLSFAALDRAPETITLLARDIADVPLREFVWQQKQDSITKQ